MSFPLLSLPYELIFNIVTKVRDLDTLHALLSIDEVRTLIAQDIRQVAYRDTPSPSIEGVQVAQFPRYGEVLNRRYIYLVTYHETNAHPLSRARPTDPLKAFAAFQNTNAFIEIQRGFHNRESEPFEKCQKLNVCAVKISGVRWLNFPGTAEEKYEITSNHVHLCDIRSAVLSYVTIAQNAWVRFDQMQGIVMLPRDQRILDMCSYSLEKLDSLNIGTGPEFDNMTSLIGPEAFLLKISPSQTSMSCDQTELHGCYGMENISFQKGSRTITMVPRIAASGEWVRPYMKNSRIIDRLLSLNIVGWFPRIENFSTVLFKLSLNLYPVDDHDLFQDIDPERDLKFITQPRNMEINNQWSLLEKATPCFENLTKLSLDIDHTTPAELHTSFPKLDSLAFYVNNDAVVPMLDAPSVEEIRIRPKEGARACLSPLSKYEQLRSLKIEAYNTADPPPDGAPRAYLSWGECIQLPSLLHLRVPEVSFESPLEVLPKCELPQLMYVDIEASTCALFGGKMVLRAPLLTGVFMVKIEEKCLVKQRNEIDLEISGFPKLETLFLRSVQNLVIKNCPELMTVDVSGTPLEFLNITDPPPEYLAKICVPSDHSAYLVYDDRWTSLIQYIQPDDEIYFDDDDDEKMTDV